ncbi:LLM class flavin-dependent oxidoreductase [Salinisphaera sp. Q1T1-3]|uniref:LLM class flavin-dependent oxidoreductase n=1 Tax=Salinisphaera sp. Q1T1-3 TaxID=2321229 RepID=UPI000E73247D|nr:LLM class flavin-dependent oxidoreductase [Salinisphaera sp. Q1T1-3]RJS93601.1 LLM class flavin-dependent oxidoreductase [Salinisphaera sp. Q1T1-3]
MAKKILFNAFDMNCVVHQSPGLWRHPRDQADRYLDLSYWTELARTLERGKFDALFLADVLGVYDVYGASNETALREAAQVPLNDPLLTVSAMAVATEHLGFGLTGTLSYEPPYTFARRLSTLDHLTRGRIGWNVVTGYLDSAARGMSGAKQQPKHDTRYDMADEYLSLVYRLWEASWEDGAVQRNRETGVFTDPARVHRIRHDGSFYQLDAIHLSEPSPQRTPVLYQAGTSEKGRNFAAQHAECVFMAAPTRTVAAKYVADIRRRAADYGRDPQSIRIFNLTTIIVGETAEAAADRHAEYARYVSPEGALALISGWTGIDFSTYDFDAPIRYIRNEAVRSAIESFTVADPDRVWTLREVAAHVGLGGFGPLIVGPAAEVADELSDWIEATDLDGFNLAYAVTPETFVDVVDLLVPELQRRGRYKTEYRAGTLREKLFPGQGARLGAPHPAAAHRHAAIEEAS